MSELPKTCPECGNWVERDGREVGAALRDRIRTLSSESKILHDAVDLFRQEMAPYRRSPALQRAVNLVANQQCQHEWEEGTSQSLGTVWTCHKCEEFTQIDPASTRHTGIVECMECGEQFTGVYCPCSYEVQDDAPA